MKPTRETIFEALFDRLKKSAEWNYTSRKLKLWADTTQGQRPALFMAQRQEDFSQAVRGTPAARTFNVQLFIYTWAKGAETPAALLNPLLDAIQDCLKPDPLTGRQTLDGLVTHVYIDGQIFVDPGDIDGDGMAIVPVKILVP